MFDGCGGPQVSQSTGGREGAGARVEYTSFICAGCVTPSIKGNILAISQGLSAVKPEKRGPAD